MKLKLFPLFFIFTSCILSNLSGQDTLLTRAYTISDKNKMLIINCFDAMSVEVRKNKKELLAELTDSLESYLMKKIKNLTNYKPIIIPGIIPDNDSTLFSLMRQNNASKAIVIRSLEVYINASGERATENSEGKSQTTTSYDLCANNKYSIFSNSEKLRGSEIENCEYLTSRSVKDSKFNITFGPDLVGKKKHTYGIVEKNAGEYLNQIESFLFK